MPSDEAAKYCEENKVQSALPKIIKTGFSAINLIYFFTAGPDEVTFLFEYFKKPIKLHICIPWNSFNNYFCSVFSYIMF